MHRAWLFLGLSAFAVACGSDSSSPGGGSKCTAGASVACVGPGGCAGGQVCKADGTYDTCICGGGNDASTDGSGNDGGNDSSTNDSSTNDGSNNDAATDGSNNDATTDGATDGSNDGGPACNPITQSPCPTGQRCTAVDTGTSTDLGCVADGTVDVNGSCTQGAVGATTGFDNCKRGLICVSGKCTGICDPQASTPCGSGEACDPLSSLNGAGVCRLTCNPLTQVSSDGKAACGSPDPGSPTLGCYMLPDGTPSCEQVVNPTYTSDYPVTGGAYTNSCAPGYVPLLFASSTDKTPICVAYCEPGPTNSTSTANATGLVGSGHTCPDAGAGGTHECRYWHMFESNPSQYSNTLGFCYDYTKYTYDPNNTGTPDTVQPSCTALSPTEDADSNGVLDVVQWGCAPQP